MLKANINEKLTKRYYNQGKQIAGTIANKTILI